VGSRILPFIGYRSWEHDAIDGRPRELSRCDMDFSGLKTYRFNRMGFRGEEFDPDAQRRIFMCGCSYTFGTGLDYEETAASRFKAHYCEALGVDPQAVNLLNFAMPGASNDYIVRTLLSQCRHVRPDVVVAIFTHIDRAEHIDEHMLGERVWTVAPWWIREISEELKPPDGDGADRIEAMREASVGYFYYFTESNGAAAFLRNLLLLQFYCEASRIPYVFHWIEFERLTELDRHFALADMMRLVDLRHFLNYTDAGRYYCDRAADRAHPGPEANANIADALFATYRHLYGPGGPYAAADGHQRG
jgi:hypothetical protein